MHLFSKIKIDLHYWPALKLVLTLALVAYCIKITNFHTLTGSLKNIDIVYFALSLLLTAIGSFFFRSIFTWKIFKRSHDVPLHSIVLVNIISRFYTVFTPRPIAAAIRWKMLSKLSTPANAFITYSAESLFTFLSLSIFGSIFALIEFSHSKNIAILGVAMSLTLALAIAIAFKLPEKKANNILRVISSKAPITGRLTTLISKWYEKVHLLDSLNLSNLPHLGVSVIGNYSMFILSSYYAAKSLDIPLSLFAIAWIRSLVLIVAHLPVTVAGIGVREVALISLMGIYNIDSSTAVAFALTTFSIQLLLAIMGGTTSLSLTTKEIISHAKRKRSRRASQQD